MFVYEKANSERLILHLHGFASNTKSSKVKALRDYASQSRKFSLFCMDMDYHTTTTSGVIEILGTLVKGFKSRYKKIFLSGSSHGAYVILNYIKLYGEGDIDAALLFAPSYSTLQLILLQEGAEKCAKWLRGEEELSIYECETGMHITIHKDFAKDIVENSYEIISGGYVNFPQETPVSIVIVHGTQDEIVPVEHSKIFVKKVKVKKYIEVEDDHRLSKSFVKLLYEDRIFEIFD
jgi:predicted esterase